MNKKILLVGWGFPPKIDGGLDIHVKHLFEEILKKDLEVDLALPEERAPDRENIIPVEVGEGDMIEKARQMSGEVAKLAEEYDIVHTHDWFGAESGFKSKKYSDVKWVSTFHSLSSSRNRNPSDRIQKMEEAAVEESDKLIAVSESLADEVEQEFGRKPEVIHNGFSTPKKSGIDVKQKYNIEGNMILYIGRHAEQKGLEHLLYGFQKLLDEEDATLVIGGQGHMTDALEKFAEILGIEENVIFAGFIPREQLGDYYKAADVFVSPSINEPFGLTITEALESGTPVVATESGVEELVGDSIVSVEPESESIKEGIKEGLEKEINKVENRSWEEMAEETLEAYRKIN